ncbi:TIGR03086 family protein [Planosporangium thailandense]|uniref:TIGR03086 family protein n=1 Tax=Planosporangium thailandense TaxID=765197 RepID=A0ABX0XX91_9ACTN|nr:TIGR03086 family metal-binding protein [Planosporangium thailandense]NJC69784.1 TIGR03086 family protein [Planosporangium thailandense]
MTENPFSQFDRSTAVAEQVIGAIRRDQFDDPTPCTDWSVRQLINHLVTANLTFVSILTGGPRPDPERDHLGGDPLAAFRAATLEARAAFVVEGALDRTYPTPFGQRPGPLLLTMRVVDTTVHAWDLAKATGQSTDLDPELAEVALSALRAALPADRSGGTPFGPEQPAPAGATAADRLAAFAGRAVG